MSLGSYCALPSIAGKLQIEVIEVTLHGARDLPIFTRPVVAANGVIVLCMVVFCLELFMPACLDPWCVTNNSSKQTLQIFATCPSERERSETHDGP